MIANFGLNRMKIEKYPKQAYTPGMIPGLDLSVCHPDPFYWQDV